MSCSERYDLLNMKILILVIIISVEMITIDIVIGVILLKMYNTELVKTKNRAPISTELLAALILLSGTSAKCPKYTPRKLTNTLIDKTFKVTTASADLI